MRYQWGTPGELNNQEMDKKAKVRLMLKDKTTVAIKGYKERNAGDLDKNKRPETGK